MLILGYVLLLLNKPINTAFTETFYRRNQVAGKACNTTNMLDLGSFTSVLGCGNKCRKASGCNSFFYNKNSRSCRGSGIIYTDIATCADSRGTVYMVKDVKVGTVCNSDADCPIQGTACTSGVCACQDNMAVGQDGTSCTAATTNLGAPCTVGHECYGEHVKCWDRKCTCRQDHHLVPARRTCVKVCPSGYGTTFSVYREYTLGCLSHVATLVNVVPRDCTSACLATACTTVRYEASTAECTLDVCSETASQADYHADMGSDLYVRDCK